MIYLQISLVAANSRVSETPLNKVVKRWWKVTSRHNSCRLWLLHLSNLKDRHRMCLSTCLWCVLMNSSKWGNPGRIPGDCTIKAMR